MKRIQVEAGADTVTRWGKIPENRNAIELSLGAGALENFD